MAVVCRNIFRWLLLVSVCQNIASAGNRTRINCLEGSYADHYTTDADVRLGAGGVRVVQGKYVCISGETLL